MRKNNARIWDVIQFQGQHYNYCSLKLIYEQEPSLSAAPFSTKILLENTLRNCKDSFEIASCIQQFKLALTGSSSAEINFFPARILMQDFTGVPALVDLAAMRDKVFAMGKDPNLVNPFIPVDLVIDHSVVVDYFGSKDSMQKNAAAEYAKNQERYEFLRWGQNNLKNFRLIPPGMGICHQVNLEYLSSVVVCHNQDEEKYLFPDTLLGTDSHTTMVNALSVLGWGVGGIEAEAAMLGEPIVMQIPEVIGVRLTGLLQVGVTATDLVLTLTQVLRAYGVVGKFVEFFGDGLAQLSLADRATIANMAPEYGATCGFFPIDQETIKYLNLTGRETAHVALVEMYAKAQGLWYDSQASCYNHLIEFDLALVEPCVAGPKRPQDRVCLSKVSQVTNELVSSLAHSDVAKEDEDGRLAQAPWKLKDADIVLAAITSCTNTSNPYLMFGAALLAKKAVEKGLMVKPWVKTSLAPGSRAVTDYLNAADMMQYLEALGFYLVGYGCTTCIGNSGELPQEVSKQIQGFHLSVASVLSGNRNFEGRIHPLVALNYLASPLLVIAYAISGTMLVNIASDPIGAGANGKNVFLQDIWPSFAEVSQMVNQYVSPKIFQDRYSKILAGDANWANTVSQGGAVYPWNMHSTYIRAPNFLNVKPEIADITQARVLLLLGDSVTTDHISPAGNIKNDSPAGRYLHANGVEFDQFNSYGSRRGNHEVMVRGAFSNTSLVNKAVPCEYRGGWAKHVPSGQILSVYDCAMQYAAQGTPLVVVAGKEYGSGSSRDWAAKGTSMLGVKAIVAESFERIHKANLIGMGVLPFVFTPGTNLASLCGDESFTIVLGDALRPHMLCSCIIEGIDRKKVEIELVLDISTSSEIEYYKCGGVMPYVLGKITA